VSLLAQWAHDLKLPTNASLEWIDAGRFHDALKDAPVHVLRQVTRAAGMPAALLHGPAAARTLEARGEARRGVIEAVEHHSIGFPGWGPAGRALYCADFLEPGRRFDPEMAAFLRRRFLRHPTDVFRDVLRLRIERALELKEPVHPQTLETWNSVR
jgi:2-amino-4-hydroxy-6-hydroxymethyldihydropteridine diphosphokinase